jgi:hypothetical protein
MELNKGSSSVPKRTPEKLARERLTKRRRTYADESEELKFLFLTRYHLPKNAGNQVIQIWFALSIHTNSSYNEKCMRRVICGEHAHVSCTKEEFPNQCPKIQSRSYASNTSSKYID